MKKLGETKKNENRVALAILKGDEKVGYTFVKAIRGILASNATVCKMQFGVLYVASADSGKALGLPQGTICAKIDDYEGSIQIAIVQDAQETYATSLKGDKVLFTNKA